MFYFKRNIPGFERLLRVMMAAGLIGYAIAGGVSHEIQIVLWVAGGMAAMTGVVGFCPMCAMVGRKLSNGTAASQHKPSSCCGTKRT